MSEHLELEESYRQRHVFARRQAVAEERERIMQDLHDGLGGHLVVSQFNSEEQMLLYPIFMG